MALSEAIAVLAAATDVAVVLDDSATAPVQTVWDGTALWIGPQVVVGEHPIGLSWTMGEDLVPLLARVAIAEDLARKFDSVSEDGRGLADSPVAILANLSRSRIEELGAIGSGLSPAEECRQARPGRAEPEPLALRTDVKQCDGLSFEAQALETGLFDINRVHIDSQYCTSVSHLRIDGALLAQPLGRNMTVCSDCPSGYSAGEERLYVLVTKALANAPPLNLTGLLETCDPAAESRRDPASLRARALLESFPLRPDLRSPMGRFAPPSLWAGRFTWRVLPRTEAFSRAGRN